MKLSLELAPFAAAVADAARALPGRPPVPVLAGLKLEAAARQLTVAAFDYEVSAQATLAADVADVGSVLVSGRLLSDITRTLKGKNTIDLELDGTRLVLSCGAIRYTLHTLPLEEYPSLPKTADAFGTVAGSELAAAVAQVAVAAGRDDTLPVLTGIQIEIADGKLSLAATDRYRFAVRRIDWKASSGTMDGQALVPAKALLDTAKMLAAADQVDLTLPSDQGVLGMAGPARSTTMRALEGQLPNYKALWPTPDDFIASAVVDSEELTAAVKRVALVADRSTPIQLHFTQDALSLTAGSSDDAQARDRIDATFDTATGAPLTIAFNPSFLLDGLGALNAPSVIFRIVSAVKPALITGANNDGSGVGEDSLSYLLMPVRLSS